MPNEIKHLQLFGIKACDTMKKARTWLDEHAVSYDFHDYKKADPHLKTAFLALGAGATPGLHAPDMHFDITTLLLGIEILVRALAKRVA